MSPNALHVLAWQQICSVSPQLIKTLHNYKPFMSELDDVHCIAMRAAVVDIGVPLSDVCLQIVEAIEHGSTLLTLVGNVFPVWSVIHSTVEEGNFSWICQKHNS